MRARSHNITWILLITLALGVLGFGAPEDLADEIHFPDRVIARVPTPKLLGVTPYQLLLKAGAVELPQGLAPELQPSTALGPIGQAFVIVQFFHSLDPQLMATLSTLGVKVLEYIPQYAFICAVPVEQLQMLASLPQVRAVASIQPSWKISPPLLEQLIKAPGRAERVWIETFAPIDDLVGADARLEPGLYQADVTYQELIALAKDPRVKWIQRKPVEKPLLAESAPLIGAPSVWNDGITGANVKIGIIDTGIDPDHPHFASINIDPAYDWVDQDTYPWDCNGHGTHCAGTIAGQSSLPCGTTLTGVAPAATLVVERTFDCAGNWYGGTYAQIFDEVVSKGATIVSCSWGHENSGLYDVAAVDQYAVDHPDVLLLFANGNYPDDSYMNSPALAKNVVAVGAIHDGSGSFVCPPTVDASTAAEADLVSAMNNLIGPQDGRVKPDVVAPGAWIAGPTYDNTWASYRGTSMATPHVTGLAALYRSVYPDRPAAAIKAALVASPIDLSAKDGQTDYPYGWGKVPSARDMLYQNPWEADQFLFTGSVSEGDEAAHSFTVPQGAEKIIVTLVWWDPPGSPLANPAIVNDLDLYVGPASSPYQYSSTSGVDTVERIIVENPTPGDWTISVLGALVPGGGTQTYYGYCKVLMDATPAGTRTWSVTASSGKSVAASTGGEEPTPAELPKGTTITVNVGVPFTLNLSWEITEFYVSGAYVTLEPMYPQIELVDGTTGYAIGELHQGEIWEAHPQFKCTEPGTYVDAIKLTWGGTNYGTWTTYIDIIATEGGIDTIGVYDPAAATFFLRNSNSAGVADLTFNYGIPNWIPIAGDWDGDGIDTIGVYNPDTATFYLRNTNTAGFADITFVYGAPNWIPIAGDWNGDGVDTIGVYDPDTATFYLRNTNTAGFADITFVYGAPNWIPIAGDWNGDGVDTIGVYDPDTATFYLRNTNTAGFADITFVYGAPNWIPIAGDWNGDGVDTIGVYDPDTATFYLRNTNTTGFADITFVYGMPNWIPIAGDWDGDGTSANSLLSTAASARNEVLQVSCTPNPLRREKSVTFSVVGEPEVQAIRVRVYDLAGELVWQSEAGGNILAWEAEDLTGRPLPNGVYLYVVEAKISGNWQNLGVYKLLILR